MSNLKKERLNKMIENAFSYKQESKDLTQIFYIKG